MRKFLSVLFVLMIASKAWGADYYLVDGVAYIHRGNREVCVEIPKQYSSDTFVIPEQIKVNNTPFTVATIHPTHNNYGGYKWLKTIVIPKTIYQIQNLGFKYCENLENVEFADVESICKMDYENYSDGSNPLSIASNLYINGKKVTSLVIPNTVTSIQPCAFAGCSCLYSITIPESVTSIYRASFKDSKIEALTYNTNVVGTHFKGNTSLKTVKIGDAVTKVAENAFYGCANLSSVTIGKSVTAVGSRAFSNCKSLKEINVHGNNKNYTSTNGVLYNKDQTKLIQYPAGKHSYSFSVDYPVTEIGDYAFEGSTELYEVEISYPVNSIGEKAFYGCSNMTYVAFWTSEISEIKPSTFYGCSKLNVAIPKSVKTIGNNAFNGCSSFTSVCIPHEATTIGYNAFEGCSTASYVTIPQGVTSVSSSAFKDCSDATIYCQASSIPSTWNSAWNSSNLPVKTGCKVVGVEKTAGSGSVSISGTNYAVKDDYGYLWYDGNNGIVTIAAKPAEGYHALWEDGMISNTRTFAVSESKTYKVSFVKHTEKEDPAVPATCTTAGKTAGKHCSVCNVVTQAQEVVPAKGHAEVTDVPVPATCTTAGKTAGKHCSVCNAVIQAQEVVPAKGHAEVTDVAVPATCTTAGKTAGKHCSVCTAVLVTQEVRPALDHLFTEYVYDNNATTEADGTETAYCDRLCGATHVRQAVGTRLHDNPTAVNYAENNHINIRSIGGSVVVEYAQADIFIYDIAGCLVAHQKPQTRNVIAVVNNGMYIVKCGTTTTKVVVM